MRPFIALLLVLTILGGVFAYTEFSDRVKPRPSVFDELTAPGEFSLAVTLTFDAAPDAFGNPAMRVKYRDQILLERQEPIAAGEVVNVSELGDIKVGDNDFFVQVSPRESVSAAPPDAFTLKPTTIAPPGDAFGGAYNGDSQSDDGFNLDTSTATQSEPPRIDTAAAPRSIARAVYVQVRRGYLPIADRTVWSDRPGVIAELIRIHVPRQEGGDDGQ